MIRKHCLRPTGSAGKASLLCSLLAALALSHGCKAPPESFVAPAGTILSISAAPTHIAAKGGVSVITVTGFDADGFPVKDGTEVFLLTTLGKVSERITTTSGIAQGSLRSDGATGSATVSAFAGGSGTVSVVVRIGSVASQLAISASPATLAKGGGTSQIKVIAFGDDSERLSGVPVFFSTTAGSLASAGKQKVTNQQGETSDALTTVTSARVTATVGAVLASVDVEVSDPDAGGITLSADPQSLPAGGGTSLLTATVTDSGGEPVQGIPVVFKTTRGTLATVSVVSTASNGTARNTLTTSASASVTATASGSLSTTLLVTVEGADIPASMTLSASPTTLPPGGNVDATQDAVELVAIVEDNQGAPVSLAPVTFTLEGPGTLGTLSSVLTNNSGVASNSLRTERTTIVRATTEPSTVTATASVTVESSLDLVLTASPGSSITDLSTPIGADPCSTGHPQLPIQIDVTATDENTLPVQNLPVDVSVSVTDTFQAFGQFCSASSGATDGSGVFSVDYSLDDADRSLCEARSTDCNSDPGKCSEICRIEIRVRSGTVWQTTPLVIEAR